MTLLHESDVDNSSNGARAPICRGEGAAMGAVNVVM